jgi:drug/metabolite transporter (DMT)-like permease
MLAQTVIKSQNGALKHPLLFFVAILSLSQAANLVRAAQAPALMIGFWRLLGAAFLMFLFHAWTTRKSSRPLFEKPANNTLGWTFLSGTFFFLHLWTFFYAAQNTTIANCMVIFSTNPVFTAMGSWALLKDRFEKRYALAFVLAFTAVVLLVSDHLTWSQARSGDFSALVSALLYSMYILTGKKARLQISTEQFTTLIYGWASVLFLAAGSWQGVQWLGYQDSTWWAIAGIILIPTLMGHVLFTHLLKYFNINWLSCGKLLEPPLSAFVAFLAFHESLKSETLISFVLTALAVMVLFGPSLFAKKPGPAV